MKKMSLMTAAALAAACTAGAVVATPAQATGTPTVAQTQPHCTYGPIVGQKNTAGATCTGKGSFKVVATCLFVLKVESGWVQMDAVQKRAASVACPMYSKLTNVSVRFKA